MQILVGAEAAEEEPQEGGGLVRHPLAGSHILPLATFDGAACPHFIPLKLYAPVYHWSEGTDANPQVSATDVWRHTEEIGISQV
jgi:hypothetical protein